MSFSSVLNALLGTSINLVILEVPSAIPLEANLRLTGGCGEAQTPYVNHEKMGFPALYLFKLNDSFGKSCQC